MKTIIIKGAIVALILSAAPALAQNANASRSESGSQALSIIQNTAPSDSRVRAAPGVVAPGLTSSAVESCNGSFSAGGSGLGWGAVLGLTLGDADCNARLDGKIMAQTGDVGAAKERFCERKKMREAYLRAYRATGAGYVCAQDRQAAAQPVAQVRRQVAQAPAPRGRAASVQAPAPVSTAGMTAQEKRAAGLRYDPSVGRWR